MWAAQGPALHLSGWEAPRSGERVLSLQEWELDIVGGRLIFPSNDQRIPDLSEVEVISSAPPFHGRGSQESVSLAQGVTCGGGQMTWWPAAPEAQEGLACFLVGCSHWRLQRRGAWLWCDNSVPSAPPGRSVLTLPALRGFQAAKEARVGKAFRRKGCHEWRLKAF